MLHHTSVALEGKTMAMQGRLIVQAMHIVGDMNSNTVMITVSRGREHFQGQATSTDGPLDAIAKAIQIAIPHTARVIDWKGRSLKQGSNAKGLVTVVIEIDGRRQSAKAEGVNTNVAFASAYCGALNHHWRE